MPTPIPPAATAPILTPTPTPTQVHQLFPFTPLANIAANLPYVLAALAAAGFTDTPMLLVALATIRAEAEPFLPLTEAESPFNTSTNGAPEAVSGSTGALSPSPFDLYDHRPGLGNHGPPDGATFRGRGFVQLTGRANYTHYATEINQPLVANPSLAADPTIAAQLLAHFLAEKQSPIRRALAAHDLALARRLVNGGCNGLERFNSAYTIGLRVLAA